MPAYTYTSDLLASLLFRAGELNDGSSDFAEESLRYLNRGLQALALGGAEFDPAIQEGWWWLRKSPPGVLTLEPTYSVGSVAVTAGSTSVVFSIPPAGSVAGWFLAVDEHPDIFRVAAHDPGAASALIDSPYTGPSSPGAAYWLMKKEYDLAPDG